MEHRTDLLELLDYIDPARLGYQDWVNVGMALKQEGYTAADWDSWSRRDPGRYHRGECAKKWNTFSGSGTPVTGGTIVQMAKEGGWSPSAGGHEIGWDDWLGSDRDELKVVDKSWVESREVAEPKHWDPAQQLITYLETLFEAAETVGYVTECWQKDDRYLPTKGDYSRTAGQLIEALSKCGGDLGSVLGDYKPEAGAWIRFNPLDGRGVKNENVTEYRYALVESDSMPIEQQNAMIRELELPVACLVHSGGKSLHAIVRIDAPDYSEYRKRVDYLYTVLKKNGMEVDTQNKNPSRLSRMPGVIRNGHKQFLADVNIGKESWAEWKEWIEGVNDDLPDLEQLQGVFDELPPLAPCLIDGVLRQGHKMLLAGPSKAGKSFLLMELCIAIAEGKQWLGFPCAQGKVLYINLELDRASCLHRFRDVYEALGWTPEHLENLDVWNLRGRSLPMDKLAPKLIRRAQKRGYLAIVIDPIYKIITGDENSAEQMALFCNQFDKVCTDLGCAVIYCHHHSKGAQGGKKSMDRASGSGVFARDPDAMLDMVELELDEAVRTQLRNQAACEAAAAWLKGHMPSWYKELSQDDLCSFYAITQRIEELAAGKNAWRYDAMCAAAEQAELASDRLTAWRIDGTLREFAKFPPVDLWFEYPIHHSDASGLLGDLKPESDSSTWKKNFTKKRSAGDRKQGRNESLEEAFGVCAITGEVTVQKLAEHMGVTQKTVRNYLKAHGGFWVDEGKVGRKS